MADFSLERMRARKQWHCNFEALKENNYQYSILYLVNVSFKMRVKFKKKKS